LTPVEFLVSLGAIGVDSQAIESAEEAWAAHASDTAGYATETVLIRNGFLPKASVRSFLCLTPAPPAEPESAGHYFVLPADPLPTGRAAGDDACTDAAHARHLPGPAIASAGGAELP
jgi:hypothetical protein